MPRGSAGGPKPGAGRPKGSPNAKTIMIREYASGIVNDPRVRATLLAQAADGTLAPALYQLFFHYAFGKPEDKLDVKIEQTIYSVELE